jgi:hypothetical protein
MVVNQNNPGEDKETVRKVQVIFGNLWKRIKMANQIIPEIAHRPTLKTLFTRQGRYLESSHHLFEITQRIPCQLPPPPVSSDLKLLPFRLVNEKGIKTDKGITGHLLPSLHTLQEVAVIPRSHLFENRYRCLQIHRHIRPNRYYPVPCRCLQIVPSTRKHHHLHLHK